MTGTMSQIRAALGMAPKEGGVPNLTCYTETPDAVEPPCFYPGEVDMDRTAGGHSTFGRKADGGQRGFEIACTVLTSRAGGAGQALLDRYLSEGDDWSLVDAIESDQTLGGLCNAVFVHHVDGYRLYTIGEKLYFGARLRVLVLA